MVRAFARRTTCSPHSAGALVSEHKEVPLSQMLSKMADMPCFVICDQPCCFSTCGTLCVCIFGLTSGKCHGCYACLQQVSKRPLVAQIHQGKTLRWYVHASGMAFLVLYGSLFLSARQPPDGERREAVLWPLAAVVALERLVLDPAQPSKNRLPADAFLTCVLASLCQHDSRDTWLTTAFLNLLEERRQALCAHLQTDAFAPDALFFWEELRNGDGEVDVCFAPLQYRVALNWLRKFFVGVRLGSDVAFVYTLQVPRPLCSLGCTTCFCQLLSGHAGPS